MRGVATVGAVLAMSLLLCADASANMAQTITITTGGSSQPVTSSL